MNFFNSLSTRIPLAIIGGILYGLLAYYIAIFFNLPSQFAISIGVVVFLFYFGSRLLILLSGVNSLYYSKREKTPLSQFYENTSFYKTAQWVGKFYHYHDIALFIFITLVAITFLITLIIDGITGKPVGSTIQSLSNAFIPLL